MKLYADRELPSWLVEWRDWERNVIDFSSGHTFRVEFLTRRNRIIHTKTTGITGSSTSPNVSVDWAVGELAGIGAGYYSMRLVATRTADSKERIFREEALPSAQILAAPTV